MRLMALPPPVCSVWQYSTYFHSFSISPTFSWIHPGKLMFSMLFPFPMAALGRNDWLGKRTVIKNIYREFLVSFTAVGSIFTRNNFLGHALQTLGNPFLVFLIYFEIFGQATSQAFFVTMSFFASEKFKIDLISPTPPPPKGSSTDFEKSENLLLGKLGWTCQPQSTPWPCHCFCNTLRGPRHLACKNSN